MLQENVDFLGIFIGIWSSIKLLYIGFYTKKVYIVICSFKSDNAKIITICPCPFSYFKLPINKLPKYSVTS